ncbi:MAG: alpha/beta hydrolase, partial [Proteobacteria bacterium]|nr:alpha/beta hydrolase [Pseudomonadota bacterium]
LSIQERRTEFEKSVAILPTADGVTFEPVKIGNMAAEWIVPIEADDVVILYLHGGGYCVGSPVTHRGMVSFISATVKARSLVIDYRLGPENPFPAAVEDATAAYRWLIAEGIAADRIVVAGDSAGGGLTVATLVALKENGDDMPAAAVCLSPWVDLEGIGDSMTTKAAVDPMIDKESLLEMAADYLGDADPKTPLAAPIYADLKGLPPLLIQVGAAEVLLDDSTRLAQCAEEAAVEVVLEVWEDMIHVFHFFVSMIPEAQDAVKVIAGFIRKQTG